MRDMEENLEFSVTREVLDAEEWERFAADLEECDWDTTVREVLNGAVGTTTRHTIPKVVRGYRHGELVGASYIIECRKPARSFFDPPLCTLLNAPRIPMYFWTRNGVMVDSNTNPGFVADGFGREAFYAAAIAHLNRRYLYGLVLDDPQEEAAGRHVASPLCDCGIVDIDAQAPADAALAGHKNLRRKTRKFANKGGSIEVVCGALPADQLEKAMGFLAALDPLVQSPYQDNYLNMARRSCSLENERVVHFLALLQGELVGYHSFALAGSCLHCLSGAFDRARKSNFHAYENLILESMRFARERGLTTIYYGPVLNPTKASLMSRTTGWEMRFYSRFAPIRAALGQMTRYSKLRPETFAAFRHGAGPA